MKTRRVTVTMEIETDIPLSDLRKKANWHTDVCRRGERVAEPVDVKQVTVQVAAN